MNNDLEFLSEVDKRLHYVHEGISYFAGRERKTPSDCYHDKEKLTEKELERIIKISKGLNFVIYPINTAHGFSVGFDVSKTNPIGKRKVLLRFKESQLPEGHDFYTMSEVFMDKANLAKAKVIGEKIENNYSKYDY